MASSYCEFVATDRANPVHREYHDREYGFPINSDDGLFERLILEVNQAGLSWETILKRRAAYTSAYDEFSIDRVAEYGEAVIERLMADPGIIRNRLKIKAAIFNANAIKAIQESNGSFATWLESRPERTLDEWVRLFRSSFKFVGPEIVNEFLVSSGYLPGAHDEGCPVYQETLKARPWWLVRPAV